MELCAPETPHCTPNPPRTGSQRSPSPLAPRLPYWNPSGQHGGGGSANADGFQAGSSEPSYLCKMNVVSLVVGTYLAKLIIKQYVLGDVVSRAQG